MKVFLLGTGNIAWILGERLVRTAGTLHGVFGRDPEKAASLAARWHCPSHHSWETIPEDADVYIFTLQDQCYEEVLPHFPHRNRVMLHTSGTLPLNLFEGISENCGVLYPFQTCTRGVELASQKLPLCLEATTESARTTLEATARLISDETYWLKEGQRQQLHLAGVFANNFSNALYCIAFDMVEKAGIPPELLHGLILETALKVTRITPKEAQTGPARRHDENVIRQQLALISRKCPEWEEIYRIMTRCIEETSKQQ
ncbi:MAG: DUF2520 domain-containing protein [Bacteroidales bacterium]|nr:DUF2520 domain-containing protein [Bacteroidales bacterium]